MKQQDDSSPSDILLDAFIKQQSAFGIAIMEEVKRTRRSNTIRSLLFFLTIAVMAALPFLNSDSNRQGISVPSDAPYVSLVRITGSIEDGAYASLKSLENALFKAFHDKKSKGVLLLINSPGGTPVQANAIYQYISFLKKETGKKTVTLAEDMATSGAYMISVSGDRIYANPSSLVGSIGVFQQSFGLRQLAERFGIEPRTVHAGEFKRRLDPFLDAKSEDYQHAQSILNNIHKEFIDTVKEGRGERLVGPSKTIFSGDYWTARDALRLGLIDDVSTFHGVLDREFSVEYALDFSPRKSIFSPLGSMISETLLSIVSDTLVPSVRL